MLTLLKGRATSLASSGTPGRSFQSPECVLKLKPVGIESYSI